MQESKQNQSYILKPVALVHAGRLPYKPISGCYNKILLHVQTNNTVGWLQIVDISYNCAFPACVCCEKSLLFFFECWNYKI